MCVVSFLGDDYGRTFPNRWPSVPLQPQPIIVPGETVTREEFEELRKEIQELKLLLIAAKRYDEETGQRDCEKDEKVELIKQLAEAVGVDLEDIFG